MGLFKSYSKLNWAFTHYVDTINGNDITSTGSRTEPYATLNKCNSYARILLTGKTNEVITVAPLIIQGDGTTAYIENYPGSANVLWAVQLIDLNLGTYIMSASNTVISGAILPYISKGLVIGNLTMRGIANGGNAIQTSFVRTVTTYESSALCSNLTVRIFLNYINSSSNTIQDWLIIESINLYNFSSRANTTYYPVFKNCLFRKAIIWKWNTAIIPINWTNNPVGGAAYTNETLMTRVYNSLLFYANSLGDGTDKTYFLAILATQDTMFKECVVWDDSDTINNPIFSRYVDGVPVDYTLALKSNNPALYMSTTGSYVGCYAANVNDDGHGNHITFGSVKHVDVNTGLDTATLPDLLVQDPSNPAKFSASQTSLQLWNRIRTSVVEYPRGKSFAGMQSQLDSGIASRLFFGKRQEIRTTGHILQKTTAFESVEVIPYDSLPTPNTGAENTINNMSATLPRFSAPFNGECLMFYKAGVPLKFNDYNGLKTLFTGQGTVAITSGSAVVTGSGTAFTADFVKDDNIRIGGVDYMVLSIASNTSLTLTANVGVTLTAQAYQVGVTVDKSYTLYGDWAVTNADIESYSLTQKATKAGLSTSIPLIKWCKFELNLHYDEE